VRAQRRIEDDLRTLGLRRGDSVIVHSSFRSIGPVASGPCAVLEALIRVLLPDGALLFPNLYIPHGFTVQNPPTYDLKGAHVSNLGILPEMFKFGYAEHFSLHPTHSLMGVGDRAPDILAAHEIAGVPCGRGTPWAKNAFLGGKVLLIGVDQRVNTTYHSAEEQMDRPYQLTNEVVAGTVLVDGREVIVPSRLHVWRYHPDFNLLNGELEERGHLRRGRVGNAPTLCLDAGPFINLALEKLASNRAYFLDEQTV
jgi:aminoglycoside 3-N-acetyltransferase